jgi:molybdenum cofactor synthesis domain-containing protein
MSSIKASIITIGDELLIGQVIDTNSAYIAQALNKIGVQINNRIAVGDNKESITEALINTSSKCNIVIITGGLGPTADDITKPLLNEFFGGKLVIHQPTLEHITDIFVNKHSDLSLIEILSRPKCQMFAKYCSMKMEPLLGCSLKKEKYCFLRFLESPMK